MTIDFNLPIDLSRLQNDRLKLVPLEDNLNEWADEFIQNGMQHSQIYEYLSYGPFTSCAEFIKFFNEVNEHNQLLLAIILNAGTVTRKDPMTGEVTSFEVSEGTFAGIGAITGHPDHASAEMGSLLMNRFQRTFVGTSSSALVLHYLLDSPEQGGLGLRRVQWLAHADNVASVRAAKRLGFQFEGVMRWHQVLPAGKKASEGGELERKGLPRGGSDGREWGAARHTAMLSLCWDDWVGGVRERIDALVGR